MKRVRCILVALVLHLAENAMESSSVSECEEVFLWLEANLHAFRTPRMVGLSLSTKHSCVPYPYP